MDAVGVVILIGFLIVIGLFVWASRAAARIEAEEDRKLEEEIKHLPDDVQVQIWSAHLRLRAERDLH